MFPVVTNNGVNEIPNDDVVYIVGKSGIFLKKKVGIVESLIEVKDIPILEDVKQYAKLHINKIPARMFARVADFFKEVYKTYRFYVINSASSDNLIWYMKNIFSFIFIIQK